MGLFSFWSFFAAEAAAQRVALQQQRDHVRRQRARMARALAAQLRRDGVPSWFEVDGCGLEGNGMEEAPMFGTFAQDPHKVPGPLTAPQHSPGDVR